MVLCRVDSIVSRQMIWETICTAQSNVHSASIAAGIMVHRFLKWLRGLMVDRDVTLNLLAAEMTVS